MKKNTLIWLLGRIRGRIPAIALMTAAQMLQAVLGVWFALGTRQVIDSATAGDGPLFRAACVRQAVIIAVMLLCSVAMRHYTDRLAADLERDWKRRLLHGDFAAVRRYHSAELMNRLNNDVARVNSGVPTIVRPDAAAAQIEEALYVSAMDDFLPQLSKGLDTVLGESGLGLSEGQAQRLAIARAVLGGAPVLLLDECTCALDPDTEEKVLARLRGLGRTVIAVTHRPAAGELCDLRLELDHGKIRTVPM